jgi:hypothetical protein
LRPDGDGQTLDSTAITQLWLRELVKRWNRQRLVSHTIGILRLDAHVAVELSNVLRLRADGGEDPRALAVRTRWFSCSRCRPCSRTSRNIALTRVTSRSSG